MRPGILILRFDAQLYFGNVSFVKQVLHDLEAQSPEPLRAVVLDCSGINQLDSSAEEALREIDQGYRERGVTLYFSRVKGPVRDVMYRTGLLQQLSKERRIFLRTHDAVRAAEGVMLPPTPRPPGDRRDPPDQIGCSMPPEEDDEDWG